MTPEKKQKMQELKKQVATKLAGLSTEDRQALSDKYGVVTIEGRSLSLHNRIMIAFQLREATVVGGYRQWLKVGKQVKQGSHGAVIWFPVGGEKDENGNITGADRFFTTTVFDISQTEPIADKPVPGVVYALTGKTDDKCIMNGNTLAESVVPMEITNTGLKVA